MTVESARSDEFCFTARNPATRSRSNLSTLTSTHAGEPARKTLWWDADGMIEARTAASDSACRRDAVIVATLKVFIPGSWADSDQLRERSGIGSYRAGRRVSHSVNAASGRPGMVTPLPFGSWTV